MTRSSTRPPGSTLTTSGSPSVRSLARNASYVTSFRSGLAAAPIAMPARGALSAGPFPSWSGRSGRDAAPWAQPSGRSRTTSCRPFLSSANICSGGVKLKSASIRMTSCWSGAVALIADDQRRRHQQLLLQSLVRMHPERSAEAQREVVVGAAARRVSAVRRRRGRRPAARAAVSPCQWIRLGSSILFSTRTRNRLPTPVLRPKVPSGCWIP